MTDLNKDNGGKSRMARKASQERGGTKTPLGIANSDWIEQTVTYRKGQEVALATC